MSDPKLGERFATPSSSKLAQILLDLRGVEGSVGICNLQQSDIQLWSEAYRQDDTATAGEVEHPSQQDTCNCRKSKCLKLYCQCFAARATCSSSCRCVSCENKPDNAATRDAAVNLILERNPNAFDSKYRPTAAPSVLSSTFTAITSIAHKNGCRCRKSMCLKKYCECFQGGVPCSSICTCLSCQNTGPAVHLAASSSAAPVATAERTSSAALTALGSNPLLLSNRNNLTEQPMFATTASTESSLKPYDGSDARFDQEQSDLDMLDAGPNSSRPPLVPSNKRKRETGGGSSSNSAGLRDHEVEEGEEGEDVTNDGGERRLRQQTGAGFMDTSADRSSPLSPLPLTPNMSRAQQQQLLRELLFQELQSQGILSSPLTSFLTTNCPGLMQSQGTTIDDINNLFRNGAYAGVSTPAAPGTLLSFTPGLATADSVLTSASAAARTHTAGAGIASPNTFSIATALALLAANAQAQAIAAQQIQQTPGSTSGCAAPVGICERGSPEENHCRSSVPASALAVDSARRLQQQAAYSHDTFASLSSLSKLEEGHACTPVPVAQLVGDHSTLSSQGGMTDEETLGTGGSSHSDDTLPDRSVNCSDLLGLPAKTLFGNDGLPSPDAVEAPRRVVLPLSKAAPGAMPSMASYGVSATRVEIEGAAKENASPNTVPSSDRMGMYGSLWR